MHWAVIIGLVLMIPILAIVLDSSVGQALANRIAGDEKRVPPDVDSRVAQLEAEVAYLAETVESLREEAEFVRRLIEGSEEGDGSRLPPGE